MEGRFAMAVPAGHRPMLPPRPSGPEAAAQRDCEETVELVDLTALVAAEAEARPKQSWLRAFFR